MCWKQIELIPGIWISEQWVITKDFKAVQIFKLTYRIFPRGGHGNPLQYSCLENPMERGAWQAKSMGSQRVRQDWSNLTVMHTCIVCIGLCQWCSGKKSAYQSRSCRLDLFEGMETHSNILILKIPWTEELGELQSLGLPKSCDDWASECARMNRMYSRNFTSIMSHTHMCTHTYTYVHTHVHVHIHTHILP